MKLNPPPGYREITPLDREKHRSVGVREDGRSAFASGLNAIYLTITEFFSAARHYPIAFVHEQAAERFLPVAITGLVSNQNLFVDQHGQWQEGVYVPAYVRRYPFCTAAVSQEGGHDTYIICVDEAALVADSPPLFDAEGEPTREWQRIETFIKDMETARNLTERLCRKLAELELLEAFEAHAHPQSGEPARLRGIHRVNENRLNALPAETVKELMSRGELSRIYAHLMSLENFAALMNLAAKRQD